MRRRWFGLGHHEEVQRDRPGMVYEPSNERVLVSGIDGVPNGVRTDEQGNLYVAANKVFVFSPEGRQIVAFPVGEPPSGSSVIA